MSCLDDLGVVDEQAKVEAAVLGVRLVLELDGVHAHDVVEQSAPLSHLGTVLVVHLLGHIRRYVLVDAHDAVEHHRVVFVLAVEYSGRACLGERPGQFNLTYRCYI